MDWFENINTNAYRLVKISSEFDVASGEAISPLVYNPEILKPKLKEELNYHSEKSLIHSFPDGLPVDIAIHTKLHVESRRSWKVYVKIQNEKERLDSELTLLNEWNVHYVYHQDTAVAIALSFLSQLIGGEVESVNLSLSSSLMETNIESAIRQWFNSDATFNQVARDSSYKFYDTFTGGRAIHNYDFWGRIHLYVSDCLLENTKATIEDFELFLLNKLLKPDYIVNMEHEPLTAMCNLLDEPFTI